MKEKGFAGVLVLIFGAIAGVLLYIAFTKKPNNETQLNTRIETTITSETPVPTPIITKTDTKSSVLPTATPYVQNETSVPVQYTISPNQSYSNSSNPTSQPVNTATPAPTGKGKGNGGGGSGIVTGG
jgi:hypothetical protein